MALEILQGEGMRDFGGTAREMIVFNCIYGIHQIFMLRKIKNCKKNIGRNDAINAANVFLF